MKNPISKDLTPVPEKAPKINLKYLRDKYREKVKGKFIFHEVPGGTMQFVYHEFKGDPVESFTLVDGDIYTLPLGVARHLNKNCWYPEFEYYKDEGMANLMRIAKKVRRCSFQSLEFVDIEDLTPAGSEGVLTVQNAGV